MNFVELTKEKKSFLCRTLRSCNTFLDVSSKSMASWFQFWSLHELADTVIFVWPSQNRQTLPQQLKCYFKPTLASIIVLSIECCALAHKVHLHTCAFVRAIVHAHTYFADDKRNGPILPLKQSLHVCSNHDMFKNVISLFEFHVKIVS